jgi:hypothetical protein
MVDEGTPEFSTRGAGTRLEAQPAPGSPKRLGSGMECRARIFPCRRAARQRPVFATSNRFVRQCAVAGGRPMRSGERSLIAQSTVTGAHVPLDPSDMPPQDSE